MIKVSRLDGRELVVNADLIEVIETTPDTIITLTTEKKLIVREPADEVIARVVDYRRRIWRGAAELAAAHERPGP